MNNRERVQAIMNYEDYDRMPIVHFGFWYETLEKWVEEGHLTSEQIENYHDGSVAQKEIINKLGFDMNWYNVFPSFSLLYPEFEPKIIKENSDGSKEFFNSDGVIVVQNDDAGSIPSEIAHSLTDRESWLKLYKPKLQFSEESVLEAMVNTPTGPVRFDEGGLDFLKQPDREDPMGLMVGSLLGRIRDWVGVVGLSYMMFDDEELLDEMLQTVSDLCYVRAKYLLETGAKFDFVHYWEDVCFKNGPLVMPQFFHEKVAYHYKRITELVNSYDITIISVDCDGLIDSLIPSWLENGVNTMFPIEVGTWDASITPWREQYGKKLKGVGGMNKNVFAKDFAAVDAEIERLRPMIEFGGYIPCPDHRIPPEAKWDNVQYYCEQMRKLFQEKEIQQKLSADFAD